MQKAEYKFEVATIKNGQPRPYADTEREFIVKDLSDPICPHDIKMGFARSLVKPVRFIDSPCPFDSAEKVEETKDHSQIPWHYGKTPQRPEAWPQGMDSPEGERSRGAVWCLHDQVVLAGRFFVLIVRK